MHGKLKKALQALFGLPIAYIDAHTQKALSDRHWSTSVNTKIKPKIRAFELFYRYHIAQWSINGI